MTEDFAAGSARNDRAPDRPLPRFLTSYLVILAIQLVVTWLNRGHIHEQGMFVNLIRDVASWYRGTDWFPGESMYGPGYFPGSPTYPMWGYPALVGVLWENWLILIAQAVVGAIAPALLLRMLLRRFPARRVLIYTLILAGLPWYMLVSVKWPHGFGQSIAAISLLMLVEALERDSLRRVVYAAVVMGIALNVRSDPLLLLPGFVVVALLLRLIGRGRTFPIRSAVVYAAVAWVCLVPWAFWYRHWNNSIGWTSSNGWFVAYSVLGQYPENPWGVVNDDEWGFQYVLSKGVRNHPFSHQANEVMKTAFFDAVREHPGAYAHKALRNVAHVWVGGFYNGDPRISPQQDTALDIMREKLKIRLGVNPNKVEIERYQRLGQWDTLRPSAKAQAAFGYLLACAALGVLFIFAATLGVVTAWRRILEDPLLLVSFVVIAYSVIVIVGILKYEPRFANSIYPYLAVFVAALGERTVQLLRRGRGVKVVPE